MTQDITAVLAHIDQGIDHSLNTLFEFLRIPSISAQPAHHADCRTAAMWARDRLTALGFTARLAETAGLPGVIAQHPGPGPDAPHILFYGHYDVQPADPLELWNAPPFAPQLVDGPRGKRIVGRGAVDDKGQVISFLECCRAWIETTGSLPVRMTVLLEGEEECGSASLAALLDAEHDALQADFALIADTNMWDFTTPAITTSLRGLAAIEVRIHGPARDLHSGLFGGAALNPIRSLSKILGAIHDDQGHITIPGFYDGITPTSASQEAAWRATGFNEAEFLGAIGLSHASGEADQSPLARLWSRPTAEINGIFGGYQGDGSKTVIPAEAGAKLSFRLVPGQDPDKILAAFQDFVTSRLPPDARASFTIYGAAPGIEVPEDAPFLLAAQTALAAEFNKPALLAGCGASIPVVEAIERQLGMKTLLVGFGLDDDAIHSPNEKFELACFHRGMRAQARLLAELAK
ncbi:MAG: hypothetical protein B7Z78_08145 [Rhodospirillales bacterium 20-60-12]|nr:MAG: hypothetical protein B7Z78_08145 [Rhodospirillales bacterium 20-60-12]